jgi:hypothetical protein
MLHHFRTAKRAATHRIELFVERIDQLFNSMDPSPFHEKDLDQDAEEFIVSWLQEFPLSDQVSLIVHVSQSRDGAQHLVTSAVHNYFDYRAKLNRLEFHHLMRQGRITLVIGLTFLSICLLVNELFLRQPRTTWEALLRESLIIAGWVAMWRPMQIFLYDWWPVRRMGRLYEKLSGMHVEVKTKANA